MVYLIEDHGHLISQPNIKILDLQNGVIGIGNYFTVLPISPPEYRKKHPTQAEIVPIDFGQSVVFEIKDDYGKEYALVIMGDEVNNHYVKEALAPSQQEAK